MGKRPGTKLPNKNSFCCFQSLISFVFLYETCWNFVIMFGKENYKSIWQLVPVLFRVFRSPRSHRFVKKSSRLNVSQLRYTLYNIRYILWTIFVRHRALCFQCNVWIHNDANFLSLLLFIRWDAPQGEFCSYWSARVVLTIFKIRWVITIHHDFCFSFSLFSLIFPTLTPYSANTT